MQERNRGLKRRKSCVQKNVENNLTLRHAITFAKRKFKDKANLKYIIIKTLTSKKFSITFKNEKRKITPEGFHNRGSLAATSLASTRLFSQLFKPFYHSTSLSQIQIRLSKHKIQIRGLQTFIMACVVMHFTHTVLYSILIINKIF